ncbi:hypothetical protein ADM90_11595 [Lysinibacillus macroides]|uniref:Uncharacterized protein n=1 Tax=Lysinibacillus macroides TaxID=33935 RepID=A0A0M9DJQ5_9BACI|nr:hypothetical protein ADM90_11595 [Lysinibacillus macroides]
MGGQQLIQLLQMERLMFTFKERIIISKMPKSELLIQQEHIQDQKARGKFISVITNQFKIVF